MVVTEDKVNWAETETISCPLVTIVRDTPVTALRHVEVAASQEAAESDPDEAVEEMVTVVVPLLRLVQIRGPVAYLSKESRDTQSAAREVGTTLRHFCEATSLIN